MKRRADDVSNWIYRGLWGVLTRAFRVPDQPPTLPTRAGQTATAFQPAEGFLKYLKLKFWFALLLVDVLILGGWLALTIAWPLMGLVLLLPALAIAILPDIAAYLAIHLRYDTTWYVISDRSLRIRRGIWVIQETTITFENVQNVSVKQGPLQRWYGIADVLVETAGGGGGAAREHGGQTRGVHQGLIEGTGEAPRLRDLLLAHLRKSRTAGLGDESPAEPAAAAWTAEHLEALREIRLAAQLLVKTA